MIVCEGEKTERRYFEEFARHYKNQIVELEIQPKGGAIRELVGKVKTVKEALQKDAGRSKDSFAKMFRVWGVPDVDEHPKFVEAMNLADDHGLDIALSNPCFELWGLLHFGEENAPMTRHEAQKKLSLLMPGYAHSGNPIFDFGLLRDKYNDAVKNAKKGMECRNAEGAPNGNPSSSVFRLTEEIVNGPDSGEGKTE